MAASNPAARLPEVAREHLANVIANLQLIADMGYGDVALALPSGKDALTVSEVRRFANEPTLQKGALHWNIPQLYHDTLESRLDRRPQGRRFISRYRHNAVSGA